MSALARQPFFTCYQSFYLPEIHNFSFDIPFQQFTFNNYSHTLFVKTPVVDYSHLWWRFIVVVCCSLFIARYSSSAKTLILLILKPQRRMY